MDLLRLQYQLISERRSALFEYCEKIDNGHFLQDMPSFGDKSMKSLLMHVVNIYKFWIGHFTGLDTTPLARVNTVMNAFDVQKHFSETDVLVFKYIDKHEGQ
jgi:uncharacterized damage-inducible protein DinB